LGVDPPEAEPALGVLVGAQPARRPVLDRLLGHVRRAGLGRAQQRLAHPVEAVVGRVDVALLGREIGVRHGRTSLTMPLCVLHMRFTYTGLRCDTEDTRARAAGTGSAPAAGASTRASSASSS